MNTGGCHLQRMTAVGRLAAFVVFWGWVGTMGLHATPPWASYTITNFADEFNGTSYDTNTWAIYDSRTNLSMADGLLHLNTILVGTNWTAAGIYTRKYHQRFGYFETRMQVARDDGLNNAFWLDSPFAFGNPYDQLEIDITEAHYHNEHHMTIHDWKPAHVATGSTLAVTNIYPGFHVVGLEWTRNDTLNFYWDGAKVYTLSATSLNDYESMMPMQIMFSTKVIPFGGTPGPNLDGSSMDVDYVRAWQKPGWLGASNGNWGTAVNWGPDGIPAAGDAAIFNGPSTNATISLATNKLAKEIYFGRAACSAYTFATGWQLQLGALSSGTGVGGITINGDVTNKQIIATDISAQNALVFANFSPAPNVSLELNGAIGSSQTNRTLYFAGVGRVNLNGALSAQIGDVIRYNPGELWLGVSNAHNGLTIVQNGMAAVAADGALGWADTNACTVVSNGATLTFANGVNYTLPEPIWLSGAGETNRQGALDLYDGSSVALNCPIYLATYATIGSGDANGSLRLRAPIDVGLNTNALKFGGSGTVYCDAPIVGIGNVTKTDSGTVVFNATNTYSGTTTVSQGALAGTTQTLARDIANSGEVVFAQDFDDVFTNVISGSGSVTKLGAGEIIISNIQTYTGLTTVSNGTLKLAASERIKGDLAMSGGVFDLNGCIETLGDVNLFDGSIVNSTGSSSQYLSGASYTVWNGLVSARLGGSGKLVKDGPGTVTLSGANTFLGGSTVSNGTLALTGTLNSQTTVEGGTISGNGTINSQLTVNGGLHTLGSAPGAMSIKNNYTLAANGTLQLKIFGSTPGTQYDQLRLTTSASTVSLAGALTIVATNNLALGSSYIIITNTATNAVVGTFANKPAGGVFYASGYWWRINYAAGKGSAVSVTIIAPPRPSLSTAMANQQFQLSIRGELGPDYQLQSSTTLRDWTNVFVTNASAMPLQLTNPEGRLYPKRFFRVLVVP